MTRTIDAPRTMAMPGGFVVVVFVVVTGILSMHGFASHGASSAAHVSAAHVGLESPEPMPESMSLDAAGQATPLLDAQLPGGTKSLAGLCLAVLSVLALVLCPLVIRRWIGEPRPAMPRRICATGGRGREPPSSTRLSVLRC